MSSTLWCFFFLSLAVASVAGKQNSTEIVYDHVKKNGKDTFREPSGILRYKYLVPAGPYEQVLRTSRSRFRAPQDLV